MKPSRAALIIRHQDTYLEHPTTMSIGDLQYQFNSIPVLLFCSRHIFHPGYATLEPSTTNRETAPTPQTNAPTFDEQTRAPANVVDKPRLLIPHGSRRRPSSHSPIHLSPYAVGGAPYFSLGTLVTFTTKLPPRKPTTSNGRRPATVCAASRLREHHTLGNQTHSPPCRSRRIAGMFFLPTLVGPRTYTIIVQTSLNPYPCFSNRRRASSQKRQGGTPRRPPLARSPT